MIDQLPLEWLGGFALVLSLVLARAYYGPITSVEWQPLRRLLLPVMNWAARRWLGEDWYATSTRSKRELVATIPADPQVALVDLETMGYEPQPLASLSEDWTGTLEFASWCRYYGPKPFIAAPYWLRERQVHVRLFVTDDGETRLTAHAETNPWRFDMWRDHYRSQSLDVQEGRTLVAADLGIDAVPLPDTHDS